jgi:hypothetical protein
VSNPAQGLRVSFANLDAKDAQRFATDLAQVLQERY